MMLLATVPAAFSTMVPAMANRKELTSRYQQNELPSAPTNDGPN